MYLIVSLTLKQHAHSNTAPCIVLYRTVLSLNAAEEFLFVAEQREKVEKRIATA